MKKRQLLRRKDGYRQHYWIGRKKSIIRVEKKGKIIVTRTPAEVERLAKKLFKNLKPLSDKITIAGSIRRKKPAKDVDIVLIPKNKQLIKNRLREAGRIKVSGNRQIFAEIDKVPVDIFFAEKNDYGAQLMTRTGPAGGNIGNRTLAKHKGMLLNQYGLFKDSKRIAGTTEKSIYRKLGKSYKSPELRG